jgi:hypothetical protein
MADKKKKKPRDLNKLASSIVDEATSEEPTKESPPEENGKNPAAVALGRLGGLKGGKARAKNLSKEQLSEIGRKGAKAR